MKLLIVLATVVLSSPAAGNGGHQVVGSTSPSWLPEGDDELEVCEGYPSNSVLKCSLLRATCTDETCKVRTEDPVTCTCWD
jgi:hypothetical protein